MWRRTGWVAVTAAILAAAPWIACAQGGATKGAGSGAASGATAGANPVATTSPANSGSQAAGGNATGSGSLMPCPPGPPYTSRPCVPAKR
jgi:hypothetical protein